MKKDVIISINGLQKVDDGQEDNVSLVTPGRYFFRDGKHYISYEESEMTGLLGTRTTLKISDDSVAVIRTGKNPSQLIFEKGKKHMSLYSTDFGDLTVAVSTTAIKKVLNERDGHIDVCYNIEIDSLFAGTNHLMVDITEAENKGEIAQ